MALPRDYDVNPERFRLGVRVTERYLTGAEDGYAHIAGLLDRAGARLIADIGCGEGALATAVRSPGTRIIGVDASPAMLAAGSGPRVQADARRLPFASGSFDAAVAVNMLYHLDEPAAAIGEAHRVLRPGGRLIVTAISRRDSPELAAVWRPAGSTFHAEDAPGIVASVFGSAEAEGWDAPLIVLPDREAVRDYLIARFVPPDRADALAGQVSTPVRITKRGAFILATKQAGPAGDGHGAGARGNGPLAQGMGSDRLWPDTPTSGRPVSHRSACVRRPAAPSSARSASRRDRGADG